MIGNFPALMANMLAVADDVDSDGYVRGHLARHSLSHATHAGHAEVIVLPSHWPGQLDVVGWCGQVSPLISALLVVAGIIYLLFGYKIFKPLIVVNAAALGAVVGALIGQNLGEGGIIPVSIVCAVLAAALTWPTMKYAVAVMGGAMGSLLGAAVWHGVGLDPAFAWSGALIGLVTGGLLSFILFRGCVVMYTSLQGAMMLIVGVLALLMKYEDVAPHVGHYLVLKPFLLPMCVFIPAVAGMMYQQHGDTIAAKPPATAAKK